MWGAIFSFIFDLLGKFLSRPKTPVPDIVQVEEKTDAKVEAAANNVQRVSDDQLRHPDSVREPNPFSRD